MKRCKNCGWGNDDSHSNCEKCNAPLDGGFSSASSAAQSHSVSENLRATVSEGQIFKSQRGIMDQINEPATPSECPSCGYILRPGMNVCPQCGHNISSKGTVKEQRCKCGTDLIPGMRFCPNCGLPVNEMNENPKGAGGQAVPSGNWNQGRPGTINPWMQGAVQSSFTLQPIPWNNENVSFEKLSFTGKNVILTRSNTDPNNQTITSKEQAELCSENDGWYIVDKSEQHTTFVGTVRKLKLEKGDIIILGNRLFEFNC